jgi:hypothetical protein
MTKYQVQTLEITEHFYIVEATSLEEAEEIYKHYDPVSSHPKSEDVESVMSVQP